MKPTCLTILLLTFFVVEIHSLPVLSTVWELLGGEDSQIKVNLTLTGTIEKVHKFYGSDAKEPAVNLKLKEDETAPASHNDAIEDRLMQQETTSDTTHDNFTHQTAPSGTSEIERTEEAATPYGEPTATTTIPYEATTEATTPYEEPSTVATSPYNETNDYELTSTIGKTTKPPTKNKCPTTFKFIDGSCFQVVRGFVFGYESADRCKQYARENNLPEDDVKLGMIRNDEQNTAVRAMAMEKELVKKVVNGRWSSFLGELWVRIWRPANGTLDDWKYMRNNQSVIYTKFNSDMHRLSNFDDQYLGTYKPGKWNEYPCTWNLVAVLCEYKETTPHSIHEHYTTHTSETSEFETTKEETTPQSEATETTTSLYGRVYDGSSDSSEKTNGHGTTSTSGTTTTTQPDEHKCPADSFKLIGGSCFQVVPGVVTGYESSDRCKHYARDNNIQEEDVGLGMIRNYDQNRAVYAMATGNEVVKELVNQYRRSGIANMWVGVWRSATEPRDSWKYMRNNQSVIYTNFATRIKRYTGEGDVCVYQFLPISYDASTWDDLQCDSRKVAVLCEYKIANMWVGVWRSATEPRDSWKYMRNNQSVIYTNFATRIKRYTGEGDVCVYQFLPISYDASTWDDLQCDSRKVAVLCEYKNPSYFGISTTRPFVRKYYSSDSSDSSDSNKRELDYDFSKRPRQRIRHKLTKQMHSQI